MKTIQKILFLVLLSSSSTFIPPITIFRPSNIISDQISDNTMPLKRAATRAQTTSISVGEAVDNTPPLTPPRPKQPKKQRQWTILFPPLPNPIMDLALPTLLRE